MCLAERAFDDAGTGAITITLGDTAAISRQQVCLTEGEFWHDNRLWASHPCTPVCHLKVLLAMHQQPGYLPKSNPFETVTSRI
jgi:hypothetical protein